MISLPTRTSILALLFASPLLSVVNAAELEEVIVEARATSTEFKTEAVSQSTLSTDWISDLYVDTFEELSFFVPGLYVQEQSVTSAAYALRGMTSNNEEATRTPRVSVWMHGMDISRTQGAYTALYDIERVDIYKGPVGSLFARGGQIGGVDITNHLAELDTSGKVTASAGTYNEIKLDGFYNQQLSENNALRFAVYHHQRDGYIENSDGTDLNSVDTQAARFSFVQQANDTRLDLQANLEQNSPAAIVFQSFEFAPEKPYEDADINNAKNLKIERDIADVFGKVTQQFSAAYSGDISVLYRDVKTDDIFDPDGTRLNMVEASQQSDYTTLETQLKLHYLSETFESTVGIGYFHEEVAVRFAAHINEQLAVRLPVIQEILGIPPLLISTDLFLPDGSPNPYTLIPLTSDRFEEQTESVDNETISIFTDNTFRFTDQLSLNLGLRFSSETLQTSIITPAFNDGGQLTITAGEGNLFLVPADPAIPRSNAEDKASGISGRLSLNYAISETLSVFGTYARGRRPDILNYTEQSVLEFLADETVDSYEAGMHLDIPESLSTIDISVYHYDFRHFATSTSGVSAIAIVSDDNASATVNGLEIGYNQLFAHDILLFTNLTYNDAMFDKSAIITGENRFRYAPLWAGAVSLSKDFALGNDWTSRLTWQESFQSEIFFEDDNNSNNGRNRQGSYGLMNIYLDFKYRKNLTINAFVKNAADKQFMIDAGNFGQLFGLPTFVPGMGRHLGAGVSYSF
jgi:iron complex outermembrane recepter protein